MKTVTKLIHINDGKQKQVWNGSFLLVETYPRAETVLNAFLSAGWSLHSRVPRVTPSSNAPGSLSFYISGWDFLFVKTIDDEDEDDSDEILNGTLSGILMFEE